MINKNSFIFGLLAGMITTPLFFGLIYAVNLAVSHTMSRVQMLSLHDMMFVAVALNIIPIRYCFTRQDYAKTGQGLLLVTAVFIVVVMLIR